MMSAIRLRLAAVALTVLSLSAPVESEVGQYVIVSSVAGMC